MSEDALQQRTFMLNKWVTIVFNNFKGLPREAQTLLVEFITAEKGDGDRIAVHLSSLMFGSVRSSSVESLVPAPSFSLEQLEELSRPVAVGSFLWVSVGRGDMLPKPGDSRLHPSYRTALSLRSYAELSPSLRQATAVGAYSDLLSRQRGFPQALLAVSRPFDGYRTLRAALEPLGVCPGPFPRTLLRSAAGLQATPEELALRTAQLHGWMGALLAGYGTLSEPAQALVDRFLAQDCGDTDQQALALLKGDPPGPKKPLEAPVEPLPPALEESELAQPTLLGGFGLLRVLRSDRPLPKADGEARLHTAYTTSLRVLRLDELPQRDLLDEELYCQATAGLLPCEVSRPFDGYRGLRKQLEAAGVAPEAFPASFAKSLVGIELSPAELQERAALLNHWMGRLFLRYRDLPDPAQRILEEFLRIERDDPANPNVKTLLAILAGSFEPELRSIRSTSHKGVMSRKYGSGTNVLAPHYGPTPVEVSNGLGDSSEDKFDSVDINDVDVRKTAKTQVEVVDSKGCKCLVM
mmetsp:Transcript_11311/g.17014  ORF Transcript_11311/g.17014 Transcript_11311/m.17014 type:complete len:523 (+) Transcript_11311:377-1945(+)